MRSTKAGSLTLLLSIVFVAPASAHVVFANPQTMAGTRSTAALLVTHGCDGAPTRSVAITIPDGVTRVSPRELAGWTINIEKRRLDTPIMQHGFEVSEVVSKIIWSGGRVGDANFQEFEFRFSAPNQVGQRLYFPVEQVCTRGVTNWASIPKEGESWDQLDTPAPYILIMPATSTGTSPP
jgi:periplasmic copper chaperone A